MGNRSEFHGSVGQVVVGNLHAAPRSSNVFEIGKKTAEGHGGAAGHGAANGGCAEQAVLVRQSRWTMALQALTAAMVLIAMWGVLRQPAAADSKLYCLQDGKHYSVGSVVLMGGERHVCIRHDAAAPVWQGTAGI